MATSNDKNINNLQLIYQPLEGATFTGKYLGSWVMPQTGNFRYKIESNNLFIILHQIAVTVIKSYGTTVWKGITGPPDNPWYTDYWLWIEPDVGGGVLQEGFLYNFMIEKCTPFQCLGGSFSYGVSIKACISVPAVVPTLPQLSCYGLTG